MTAIQEGGASSLNAGDVLLTLELKNQRGTNLISFVAIVKAVSHLFWAVKVQFYLERADDSNH